MTQILRLEKFAEVGAGNAAPQNEELFKDGFLPFVRTSDVGAIHIGSIETSRDLLTQVGSKGLKLQQSGTILFPKSGASTFLNHRVVLSKPAYVSSHLATIKANNDLALDRYLFHFLQTIDARDLCQDQAYPSLNRDQIGGIEVPLPSLDVQREIVEKLDGAFTEIDRLEGNLEKNYKYMAEIEASIVLNLWKKYSNELTIKPLSEVAEYKNGSAHEKIVNENGNFIIINSKFISSDGLKSKKSSEQLSPLKIGDVTMVLSDVPNGKALAKGFLVDRDGTYTLNQRICKLNSKILLPEFLLLNISRNPYLLSFNNGENQTNLRLNDVLRTPIHVADLKTQQLIIDEYREARNTLRDYSSMNIRKGEFAILLRQSLLSSCFSSQERVVA